MGSNIRICCRCMRKTEESVCPWCGFDLKRYVLPKDHLAPMTILHDNYVLGISVGRGGFGITYIAYDLHLQVVVAVKELFLKNICQREADGSVGVLPQNRDCFEENRQQFLQEARVLAMLREETRGAVVSVREHFEERKTAYLVMEYLEGQTLREYVSGQKQDFGKTLEILTPVAKALTVLHGSGLVHRDVSPDNIMVLKNGQVRLLDFGGAVEYDRGEQEWMVSFKRGYAPPEQYQQGGRISPQSDVYSLAATVCYCLTGKRPPDASNKLEREAWDLARDAARTIPKAGITVLLTAMDEDPVRRYRSMEEFWRALERSGWRRKRRLRWLAGILGVALVGGIGFLAIGQGWIGENPNNASEKDRTEIELEGQREREEQSEVEENFLDPREERDAVDEKSESEEPGTKKTGHPDTNLQNANATEAATTVSDSNPHGQESKNLDSLKGESFTQESNTSEQESVTRNLNPQNEKPQAEKAHATSDTADSGQTAELSEGDLLTGKSGKCRLALKAAPDRCLGAIPNLLDEPPTLTMNDPGNSGTTTWILEEQSPGTYTVRADPTSVGIHGFLEEHPEDRTVALQSESLLPTQEFIIVYAGDDSYYLKTPEGGYLAAFPELFDPETGFLHVIQTGSTLEACKWCLYF